MRPIISSSSFIRLFACAIEGRSNPHLPSRKCWYRLKRPHRRIHIRHHSRRYLRFPWAHYNQGHFFSDWRTIRALYPMFSPAKGVGYSDILIPSHYYFSSTKRYTYGWDPVNQIIKDVDDMETKWEDKSDDIFWRGATTGGGSSPPGFLAQYQRHR
jgi:hypothetical protein